MASGRGQLTSAQNDVFHANYEYMWKKLSVTYYQVSQTPEKCREIRGREHLPSYAYLCRCLKTEYVPTLSTVNKIVDFYNANIRPKVSSYQFVSELLSAQDAMRHRVDDCRCIDRFSGIYCGYSLSGEEDGRISGSLMHIYAIPEGEGREQTCRVCFVDGICDPELMCGGRLLELIKSCDLDGKSVQAYFTKNGAEGKQTFRAYTGEVQIQTRAVVMNMHSFSNAADRVCIAMDIGMIASAHGEASVLEAQTGEKYDGGMAVVMKAGEREGIRAFLMGLVRADAQVIPHMSANAKKIARLLRTSAEDSKMGRLKAGFEENQKWRAYLRRLKRESKEMVRTQKHNAE